jgi:hypothetical protein
METEGKKAEDSDRYNPSEDHSLADITNRTGKHAKGYVCPKCGHLSVDEDELLGKICPKCLQEWLIDHNVQQMSLIDELKTEKDSALVPTIKENKIICNGDDTTKIMPKED